MGPAMRAGRALVAALAAMPVALPAHADEPATFSVLIEGGRIVPARLEVPAQTRLKLTLRNQGPGPAEFENLELRVEKVLVPGARSFIVIHPLKPGTYRFIDEFHPDTGQMLLVVR